MKKFSTLFLAVMASVCLMATEYSGTVTFYTSDAQLTTETITNDNDNVTFTYSDLAANTGSTKICGSASKIYGIKGKNTELITVTCPDGFYFKSAQFHLGSFGASETPTASIYSGISKLCDGTAHTFTKIDAAACGDIFSCEDSITNFVTNQYTTLTVKETGNSKNLGVLLLDYTIASTGGGSSTYTVTYNGNGNTSGEAPTDATEYTSGASVSVAAKGDLAKTGYDALAYWNTKNDGSGTSYAVGTADAFTIVVNVTLYAKWTQTITLNANTANHGKGDNGSATATYKATALSDISAPGGDDGYTLKGYYTAPTGGTKVLKADGKYAATNVTDYITEGKWTKAGATELYAQWAAPGAELTTHIPGIYEKAAGEGGYGQTLVTVDSRDYEIYGFSSTGSSTNFVWAGTTSTNIEDAYCILQFATTTAQKNEWISNAVNGRGSEYTNLSAEGTEFNSMGSSGARTMAYRSNSSLMIKVQGYDQFSMYGKDNGTTDGKKFVVKINNEVVTTGTSKTESARRYTLNKTLEYVIEVTGDGTDNNTLWGFSLRLPTTETAIDNTADEVKAVKFFENGQLLIEKNGKVYNAQGVQVR